MAQKQNPAPAATGHGANSNIHCHYTARDTLLSRLDRVRQTGPGRWLAACPGPLHQYGDRHPSLGVRETDDGRLLLRCYAGCDTADVLAAVGLEFGDLFPPRPPSLEGTGNRPKPPRFMAAELIRLAAFEAGIVALAGGRNLSGTGLDDEDRARMALAVDILRAIWLEVDHGHH